MAELPYMQFFPADWLKDTRMLTASAKGVWIDTLAALWNAPERGFLKRTERAWGRLWGVEPERVPHLLEELEDVAEVKQDADGVLIASRRMVRDEIERERSRNSKRAEDKREWTYRETISRVLPEMLPADSRKPPAGFPEPSRPIPGESPETRDQRSKLPSNARENTASSPSVIPTVDEVKRYAASAPVPISEACAVAFHDTQQAEGWITRNGHPIADWRAALRRYASRWNEYEKSKGAPPVGAGRPRPAPVSGYGESTDISEL
ncbi:hypothetical protein [Luteolibacter marinus]|uniref:hypothetical protein n=1 Tax=Luteolibacter marinus TaxID=2776705 RepID=UPI001869354E|nr:hypothetical protein [Luteolibacter marinus]